MTLNVLIFFQNPINSDHYVQHSVNVTVAKYAPSGFYIASGGNYHERIDDYLLT